MDMNFSVFQEPRGVMRIIQFVFSICAFATICNYTGYIDMNCGVSPDNFTYSYPFDIHMDKELSGSNNTCKQHLIIEANFSSDSRFFVATGVISMLYCIVIVFIYTKMDQLYKSNQQVPLIDFLLSVFIAVLWLSSSASWANSLSGIKHVTDPSNIHHTVPKCPCFISIGGFSSLNISVILGFLNFFLWAADLWFLYKETTWFQNATVPPPVEN